MISANSNVRWRDTEITAIGDACLNTIDDNNSGSDEPKSHRQWRSHVLSCTTWNDKMVLFSSFSGSTNSTIRFHIYTRPMWSIRHASDINRRIVQSKVSHTIIRHTEKLRNSVKEEKERARERAEIRVTQCTHTHSNIVCPNDRMAHICCRFNCTVAHTISRIDNVDDTMQLPHPSTIRFSTNQNACIPLSLLVVIELNWLFNSSLCLLLLCQQSMCGACVARGICHLPQNTHIRRNRTTEQSIRWQIASNAMHHSTPNTHNAHKSKSSIFGRFVAAIQFTFIRFNSNSLACSAVTVAYVVESRIHDLCFVFNQRLHGNCFACIVHLWSIIIHYVASHSWFSRLNRNQYPNIQQSSHCVWFNGEAATTIHNSDDIIGQ